MRPFSERIVDSFHEESRPPMKYSDEEIRHQLRLGEDSSWEFKAVEFAGSRPTSPAPRRLGRRNRRVRQLERRSTALRRHRRRRGARHVASTDRRAGLCSRRGQFRLDKAGCSHPYLSPTATRWQAVALGRRAGGRFATRQPRRELRSGGRIEAKNDERRAASLGATAGTGPVQIVRRANRSGHRFQYFGSASLETPIER